MAQSAISAAILLQLLFIFQVQSSQPYSKKAEYSYGNFQIGPKGFVINTTDVVGNITTQKIEECQIECIKHNACLSLNAINGSSLHCEFFNKSSTKFIKQIVPKANSYSMQIRTICQVNNPCKNSGECIANTGPYKYICNCTNGYTGRNCEKKCILFDFENGSLDGWALTGTAFNSQPTFGDHYKERGYPASGLKGNWWINTIANRPSPSHTIAGYQGYGPVGTMTSPPFIIQGTKIKFLISGGNYINEEFVELLVDGSTVAKATGAGNSVMTQKTFDVTNYRNQVAQIRIVDKYTGTWGVIAADHFEDSICTE